MNASLITPDLKHRLTQFLHESFEDSRHIPSPEMDQVLDMLLHKAVQYGFDNEADLASYVITSYVLGADFDTEVPEAAQVLTNSAYTSNQKATIVENFAKQAVQALESNPALAAQVAAAQQTLQETNSSSMTDYVSMESASAPYREVAGRIIAYLVNGDLVSILSCFSPNFLNHLGINQVQQVFQTQLFPFFADGQGLGPSQTITLTHDAFGSQGFAFYLTLAHPDGEKPFIMYMVSENGRIVVANLVLHKTYADTH